MPGNAERFHPGRVIMSAFAAAIAVGSALLALPIATEHGSSAGLLDAVFTSTSAVCVTGLVIVDTGSPAKEIRSVTRNESVVLQR